MGVTKLLRLTGVLALLALAGGCTENVKPFDYTDFRANHPASILVLPPTNSSLDVGATNSVLAQATLPLAESGYYVLPVSLVDETFRENGLTSPEDIHALPLEKLHEIYGADAVLYIDILKYGTSYYLVSSETRVTVSAKLVDLRSGVEIWNGEATASSAENRSNSSAGIVGLLVEALARQVLEDVSGAGHGIAGIASSRLLSADWPNSVLYGPRSPNYK